ncbi:MULTISPECIES: hypothetical protein [Marinobacter]|uniref:Conjugal transfer protein TraN n=1 Tax=Marinobacter sp. MMG032 TaxID=3158548 RepID=A0AAU7MTE5_9GAMM|nr:MULTISPECIES: hypothetical protein [Marinobacter]MBY5939010.1 hypothetical protein [Marinobacter nauticus]MBY5956304.1 hypothetical protein [Marinobacter nauticus]MBY6010095.1 hypothetical protein [Marinobacter nauticus]
MRYFITILVALLPCTLQADPASVATAESTVQGAMANYGSADAIKENLTAPLMSDDAMKTFDGTQFSAKLGCNSSQQFLEMFIAPSASGDITTLQASQDTNLDGVVDHIYAPSLPISGVCANGAISCDAGTWNNCSALAWTPSAAGELSLAPTDLESLGGCYCINNSCGSGLVMGNLEKILSDLGGGATGSLTAQSEYLTISEVGVSGPMIKFYAQKAGDCATGSPLLKAYKGNPGQLSSDAFAATSSDPTYDLITNSPAANANAGDIKQCVMRRTITVAETVTDQFVDVRIAAQGRVYLTIEFDFKDGSWRKVSPTDGGNVQAIVPTLDHGEICGNGLSVAASSFHQWTGATGMWGNYDTTVHFRVLQEPSCANNLVGRVQIQDTTSGGNAKYWLGGRFRFKTQKVECTLSSDAIYDGCNAYRNDTSCVLKEEDVDGVTTMTNYVPTSLTPLPTVQPITGSYCNIPVTRDWWEKKRTYLCETNTTYNFDDALARADHVQTTTTGTGYEDYLKQSNGSITTPTGSLTTLSEVAVPACTQACKTRKPRRATDATQSGVVLENRTDPDTYDYFYRECSSNVCPLEAGETIVEACDCLNEFGDAAATVQAIRQASRDTICTTGAKAPL